MKLFLQRIKNLFSAFILSSKDAGKYKIVIHRKISNSRGDYSFYIIIESEPRSMQAN